MLLVFQTGWSVAHFIGKNILIEVLPFRESSLMDSALWFNALLQVIYSTGIGFVKLIACPMITSLKILFLISGLVSGQW